LRLRGFPPTDRVPMVSPLIGPRAIRESGILRRQAFQSIYDSSKFRLG
jgi:hypothetical protein